MEVEWTVRQTRDMPFDLMDELETLIMKTA